VSSCYTAIMKFVVLSSSRGTTFQAILDCLENGSLTAECFGLISDREDRGCVEKAHAAGIDVKIVQKHKGEEREKYDQRLHSAIQSLLAAPHTRRVPFGAGPCPSGRRACPSGRRALPQGEGKKGIIALIGWMYILSPWFVRQYPRQIINVHPSLLPKYPGLDTHRRVLGAGEKETGMTIHWVDAGLDTGPIIVQKKCPVFSYDTESKLKSRVQDLEKEWYPQVLQMLHSHAPMSLPT